MPDAPGKHGEPWVYEEDENGDFDLRWKDGQCLFGMCVCYDSLEQAEELRAAHKRIVACVNACWRVGVTNPKALPEFIWSLVATARHIVDDVTHGLTPDEHAKDHAALLQDDLDAWEHLKGEEDV